MDDFGVYLWFLGRCCPMYMEETLNRDYISENIGILHFVPFFSNLLTLGKCYFQKISLNILCWFCSLFHPWCFRSCPRIPLDASVLNPRAFESLKWSDKFISRHTSLPTPSCDHVLEAEIPSIVYTALVAPLRTDTSTPVCLRAVFTGHYLTHTPSRIGDQPLHVKPFSCPLCSLIKIRFCLCCHIWYGFPACSLGWGPAHSV